MRRRPLARRVGGTWLPRWLRSVVFALVVLAQAVLLGQVFLVVLGLLALGMLVAFRPEMIRSDFGWPHGLRKALRVGRAVAPASSACVRLAVAAVPVGLAAGMLGLPAWAVTLLASAAATAALTGRLTLSRPAERASALTLGPQR